MPCPLERHCEVMPYCRVWRFQVWVCAELLEDVLFLPGSIETGALSVGLRLVHRVGGSMSRWRRGPAQVR